MKVCVDTGARVPSIENLKTALEDEPTLQALKVKYSRRARPKIKGLNQQTVDQLQRQEELELQTEFDETFGRFRENSGKLLSSDALVGFKTIRDKLISHNELCKSNEGYRFFDINVLNLKIGQERQVLEAAVEAFNDLELLVCNASMPPWDEFLEQEKRQVCKFWDIEAIEAK